MSVKVTSNLHLVTRLKMGGAIPPFAHGFSNTSANRGVNACESYEAGLIMSNTW